MTKKYKFKPFMAYAESTPENLQKLNSLRSLYYGYQDSGIPVNEFAEEFYRAVGEVLIGRPLRDLELEHLEFER